MPVRATLLAAAMLALATSANAQTVPQDTAAFVAYCSADANFQACRLKVVDINNIMLIRQIGGSHGCTIPRPTGKSRTDSVPATEAILDWLRKNESSRPAETGEAIAQAIETLWPGNCEH